MYKTHRSLNTIVPQIFKTKTLLKLHLFSFLECMIHLPASASVDAPSNLPGVTRTNSTSPPLNASLLKGTGPTAVSRGLDAVLLHDVYTNIFRLRDGSTLSSVDSTAIDAMKGSVRRILAAEGDDEDLLLLTRSLPDDRLLGLLLLAVAGNFTVDQSPSALPQRCGIVVDPGTGVLMLRDNSVAQSVILEVLLIVSIVCLLRSWSSNSSDSPKT
jgi:hypothetical protein